MLNIIFGCAVNWVWVLNYKIRSEMTFCRNLKINK